MKNEENYYDKLRREIGATDYENYEPIPNPSGANGFSATERKIITIICAFFLAFLLFARGGQLFAFLARDRELTVENYKKYVDIKAVPHRQINPDAYDLVVTATKYDLTDVQLTVTITHAVFTKEEDTKKVSFSIAELAKGEEYRYEVTFDTVAICRGLTVAAISGRVK